ncbi:hypothetical protein G6F16_009967 [Rhizopus arrhizus]|nr:hypothetical protein G6F16_009967 [Rhizopus arrhizus]
MKKSRAEVAHIFSPTVFTCALEKWGDSSELLNPYFNLTMIIPNNGSGALTTATNVLNKINNHKEVLQSVKTYCNRLETYYKKKIVKDQFIAIYKSKELSVTLKQPGIDRLLVDGTGISELFYQMQQITYQSVDIIDIVGKVYRKNIDCLTASASLLSLADNMTDTIDKKLMMPMLQLIQFLPMDSTYECISETTYITRYILPMIQPLFDDHDKNILLDFTLTEPVDKSPTHASTFNDNTDCIITSFMHETDNGVNIGYREGSI